MRVIIDANIVFSGILNSNGKIGDLLINSKKHFDFIAPDYLRTEIYKHYSRLSIISGMSIEQVRESEFQICKDINFISEEQIKNETWLAAEKLVADIDPKDTHYVACIFRSMLTPLFRGKKRIDFHFPKTCQSGRC